MKILLISILLMLTQLVYSQDKAKEFKKQAIQVQNENFSYTKGKCSVKIIFPKLSIKDEALYKKDTIEKINTYLKDEFKKMDDYKPDCSAASRKGAKEFNLVAQYTVQYNRNNLLSIYYYAVGYTQENAHPNNKNKSYNINVLDAKNIQFSDLFKSDADYMSKVKDIIAEELVQKGIFSSKEEYQPTNKSYDFYLTSEGITIFNLFSEYVLQGVEVNISFKSINDLLNYEGVLKNIKK